MCHHCSDEICTLQAHVLSSEQNRQNSTFLRLPGELRNEIYKVIFGSKVMHAPCIKCRKPLFEKHALLFVCRQIFEEVENIFWPCSTFQTKDIREFIDNFAGEKHGGMITSIAMMYRSACSFCGQKPYEWWSEKWDTAEFDSTISGI